MKKLIEWAKPYCLHPSWSSPAGTPAPLYTHETWAKKQMPVSTAVLALATTQINASFRHCHIGKITLK